MDSVDGESSTKSRSEETSELFVGYSDVYTLFLKGEQNEIQIVASPSLKPEHEKFVELPALQQQAQQQTLNTYIMIGGTVAVVLVVGIGLAAVFMRRKKA